MVWRSQSSGTFTVLVPARYSGRPRAAGGSWLARKLRTLPTGAYGSRWAFEVVFGIASLLSSASIVSLLARHSGWPIGEAWGNPLIEVQIYAAHFRHHDFFPIWSSSDAYGLGTPVLLYYQKAFFYVAAPLYMLSGSLKTALTLAIVAFLLVGAYGMRLAVGTITNSRLLLLVGPVGFLFTNYVFTDWLVRGDLGEFSALMVVPWLLWWCLNLVRNRRASLLIIPIMVVLVDAHNAIALLSLILLTVTFVVFVLTSGVGALRAASPRLIASVVAVTIILGPMLLAELKFAKYYEPAVAVSHYGANVSKNFYSTASYFYNGSYRWLADNPKPVTVQIDFALWVPIAIGLMSLLVACLLSRRRRGHFALTRYFCVPVLLLLLVTLLIYFLLQLRASLFVYDILSPLQVIDYPYRMLAFITPMALLVVMSMAEALFRTHPHRVILRVLPVLWLAALIAQSPLTSSFRVNYSALDRLGGERVQADSSAFPPTSLFTAPKYMTYSHYGLFVFGGTLYGEYLPKVMDGHGHVRYSAAPIYNRLHSLGLEAQSLGRARCSVVEPPTPFESLTVTYRLRCSSPTRLALPISYNDYTAIFAMGPHGQLRKVTYTHVSTDPRIIIEVPSSRPMTLLVHLPTLGRVFF
jgi:hypothetical protein